MSAPARELASDRLRPAGLGDVQAMSELIDGYAAQGLMLPKSVGELCRLFREYRVVADEHGLLGCGGLRVYSARLAEIVGLAVAPHAHGRGIGAALVRELVAEAEGLGLERVFAMTLQVDFFRKLGFEPVPMAWLPEKAAADCTACVRRAGCREVAVMRVLRGEALPAVRARGRALRVVGTPASGLS